MKRDLLLLCVVMLLYSSALSSSAVCLHNLSCLSLLPTWRKKGLYAVTIVLPSLYFNIGSQCQYANPFMTANSGSHILSAFNMMSVRFPNLSGSHTSRSSVHS